MRTNRALRTTAIILFVWIGLRFSFLLLSSNAKISAPLARKAETVVPVQGANIDNRLLPQTAMIKRTGERVKTKLYVPVMAPASLKGVSQSVLKGVSQSVRLTQRPEISSLPKIPDAPEPASTSILSPSGAIEAEPSQPRRRQFPDPLISAWAIVRPSSSLPILATNGQLGASQIGFRIQQPIARNGKDASIALNLRVSTPVEQKQGSEAGIGLSIQPVRRIPIAIIAERRIALDRGGRNALALIAAGGFDDKRLIKKTSISGYAQAGLVGFANRDGFIDGSFRLEQTLLGQPHTALRIGGGLWGAAQPGVERIDVGPIVAVKQRAGSANLRISAEYRWRVAGKALPASGPALTIGADF
jgi:hypothetical protein